MDLLVRLSIYELDIILTDSPIGPQAKVKAFNHLLGESGVSVYASAELASQYRQGYPKSLSGAPFLLPTANTSLRRSLDAWFAEHNIIPNAVAEFEDSALIGHFGRAGHGLIDRRADRVARAAPGLARPLHPIPGRYRPRALRHQVPRHRDRSGGGKACAGRGRCACAPAQTSRRCGWRNRARGT